MCPFSFHSQNRYTIVMAAAEAGSDECLDVLLDAGADANTRNQLGETALLLASRYGYEKCVSSLVRAGADVNATDHFSTTSLMNTAVEGHAKCTRELIAAGANMNMADHLGYTALIFSAQNGFSECVDELLKAGADLNASSKGGQSALSGAARCNVKCVDLLIKAGADVNQISKALHYAADYSNEKCVNRIIQARADVNLLDYRGRSALMKAVKKGYSKCGELLIVAGPDVNIADNIGDTALMYAASYNELSTSNDTRFIIELLKAGAHVNIRNRFQQNGLESHIALRSHVSMEQCMLLQAAGEIIGGTTVNQYNNEGEVYLQNNVPDFLLRKDLKLCLKHACRETIRKHLIDLDPHKHLFDRIPQLGIPFSLTEYLLYNVSLMKHKTLTTAN